MHLSDEFTEKLAKISTEISKYPRADNGLTPDNVKALPAYAKLKTEYRTLFNSMRVFNSSIPKKMMRDARDIRRARKLSK